MGIFSKTRKSVKDYLPISNAHGIHIRPATNIYLLAEEYPETNVMFFLRGKHARGKNINEIIALSAGYHDQLEVKISGPKAKQLLKKLRKLFADFDQYNSYRNLDLESGYGRLLDDRCWDN